MMLMLMLVLMLVLMLMLMMMKLHGMHRRVRQGGERDVGRPEILGLMGMYVQMQGLLGILQWHRARAGDRREGRRRRWRGRDGWRCI